MTAALSAGSWCPASRLPSAVCRRRSLAPCAEGRLSKGGYRLPVNQPTCRHVRRSDRHGRLLPGQPGQRAGCVLLGIPAERRQEGPGGPGLWSDPRRSVTALILIHRFPMLTDGRWISSWLRHADRLAGMPPVFLNFFLCCVCHVHARLTHRIVVFKKERRRRR